MGLISGYDEEIFYQVEVDSVPKYDTQELLRKRENARFLMTLSFAVGDRASWWANERPLICHTCSLVLGVGSCSTPCSFVSRCAILEVAVR